MLLDAGVPRESEGQLVSEIDSPQLKNRRQIVQIYHDLVSLVEDEHGESPLQTPAALPLVGHSRVGGWAMKSSWWLGIHNVGFRITWWDNRLGLMEFYGWNSDDKHDVHDITMTFRGPDKNACIHLLELIGLIAPEGSGL